MILDEDGISCGLENLEHIPKFLEKYESDDFYKNLKSDVPWQEVTRGNGVTFSRLVFRYGEFERQFQKYDVLEDMITYVEEVLETDISSVWCNLYRNGKDFTPYHQENYNSNVFVLSLGKERKFSIRKVDEPLIVKHHTLNHGDAFYFNSDANRTHENSTPKSGHTTSHIDIIFFMDEPYSRRKRHFRTIKLLGYEDIPVWFEGPESQFPKDAVASILPMPRGESYRGPLALSRPDFGGSSIDSGILSSFIFEQILDAAFQDEPEM